jgi:chromosome segregation ATPase
MMVTMDPEVKERLDMLEMLLESLTDHQAEAEARFQRRLNGITVLIRQGMHIIVNLQQAQKHTDENLNILVSHVDNLTGTVAALAGKVDALAEAQRATEQSLKAFIDSLNKGTNGHHA